MFNVSKEFNQEINKLQGRKFNAKVIIRDKEFIGSLIYEMSLEESVNPSDSFSIGTVCSNNFEIKLINTGDVFENAVVKPYVGLYIGEKVEYVPLGVFNVVKSNINGKFINLECVDNMLKLEGGYFSDLSYPADINDIAKEICKKVGINLASKLPNYRVNKIEGYSLREAIGFIASLCGSFARFNRIGDLEIKGYETVKQEMTPNNLFKLDIDADECIIRKIIAQKGEEELSVGIDEGNKIIFDNPVITKEILNDIYSKYDGFKYIPYTAKWKGNPAIMAGDVLGLTDTKGNKYNALIMEQKFVYKNGISSEVKAKGKSKQESNFDSKGSMTKTMERYSIEQASIKKALIDKANINDLTVVNAKIERLYTEDLTAIRADIVTLNSQKANITELNAVKADLQQAIINKANITDLNAAVGKINVLESKTGNIENLLAGNLTANNFKANSITVNSGIIAEGAIGDAQISSVSANKMRTGTLDTGVVTVAGPNGRLKILGNKLQIFDDVNNRLFERIMLGINDKNRAALTLRGADGQTVLLTEEGLTKAGITDGFNKADDNSLNALKIDKNSIVRQVNGATETIAGTRIQVGDRTLDIELSTQKNTITEHGKELSTQKASIQALDNAIKLKVDTQTFTQSTTTINHNINRAKEEAINESRSILDTRKDNQNPEWYMSNHPRKTISEFKYANVIGIPNAKANFGVLETKIPWDNPSGGYPTQVFRGNNYPTYQRRAVSNTLWGEWEQIEDTQGSQDKANSALNNAKEYTNSEITIVNTHLNKATTEINLLKGEINLKVNQTDIDKTIKTIEDKIKSTTEKITTVESSLTQKTNSIEANVRDLNSITQTIKTNLSNINSNMITVNNKVHNLESGIDILKDQIKSKVSQSDVDKSITTVDNKIKLVDSKISDVSSNVTQLKDSVETSINSINSKTQSLETSLNGKVSKQELTIVDNKVANIKASLDGITQRVSSTESKTQTLEHNINDKASKQEVVNLNSKVVDITANLNGITQRVSSTETFTKSLNDKLWETTNKLNNVEQRITPTSIINMVSSSYYQKGEANNLFSTKSEVEQLDNRINYRFSNTGYSNLIFNGNFANGTVHWKNWGNCSLVAENGQLLVRAKQSSEKANMGAVSSTFVLEKDKKYSLSFQGASCWNIPWLNYVYLLGEDGVNYRLDLNFNVNSADLVYRTATFTAPATKYVRLLIGIEGYLQTDISGFKLVDVCLVEGDIPRRFIPNANEISEGSTSIDSNGVVVRFADDSYVSMTHGGFAWKTKNMEKAYHCLAETGWVNISTGAWLGDHYDIKITLPSYFRGKVFTPCSMIQGWYVESNFSLNQLVVNIPYETINYSEGSFVIRVKALTRDGTFQRNINISWLAIA